MSIKEDWPRPYCGETYRSNYNNIFNKCPAPAAAEMAHTPTASSASTPDNTKNSPTKTMTSGKKTMTNLMKKVKRHIKWLADMVALIGTMPDRLVAKTLGLKESSVTRMRYEKRIKAFPEKHQRRGRKMRVWTQDEIEMLGTMPDRFVANRIGISSAAVCKKRHKLNIKARLWK